jgi:hypothetical protein
MNAAPDPGRSAGRRAVIAATIGLSPIWVAIVLTLVAPAFMAPMGDAKVSIAGFPAGQVILGGAFVMAIAGAFVIWRGTSAVVRAAAFVLLTFPAILFVVFGPATVLILENLGAS